MAIQSLRREKEKRRENMERRERRRERKKRERGPVIFLKYCLNVSVWEGRLNLLFGLKF